MIENSLTFGGDGDGDVVVVVVVVVVDAWQPSTVVAIGDRAANRCEFTEFTVCRTRKPLEFITKT